MLDGKLETYCLQALKMNGKGCDWLNRWLIHEKGAKVDRFFEPAVRDELLVDDDNRAFDLPALSTQVR